MDSIRSRIAKQQAYFRSGRTRDLTNRITVLEGLEEAILRHEEELYHAFAIDLGKSRTETYMAEISVVLSEIRYLKKHLRKWARPETVPGTLGIFPGKSRIYREPYGVVLVLAPWNYPLLLAISPLAGAVAAGNCVMLKCSKSSPHCAKVIRRIVEESAPGAWLSAADPETPYEEIVGQEYNYIFFTGSPRVGRTVMAKAAEQLIPVSLELGGKSPCIVTASANIRKAAKRIVWGKLLNAGQTCITVDYILVEESVKAELLRAMRKELRKRYPNPLNNSSYPRIINDRHFRRLMQLIEEEQKLGCILTAEGQIGTGGISVLGDPDSRRIVPVIIPNADRTHPVMEEEIFGPIFPVIGYTDLNAAVEEILDAPRPLACYLFTEDRKQAQEIIGRIPFGGGCVNDTILHISNHHMPFGGVGNSGMGGYHGRYSFETFSHKKSMVENTTRVDFPIRYAPYSDAKWKLLKKLL